MPIGMRNEAKTTQLVPQVFPKQLYIQICDSQESRKLATQPIQ